MMCAPCDSSIGDTPINTAVDGVRSAAALDWARSSARACAVHYRPPSLRRDRAHSRAMTRNSFCVAMPCTPVGHTALLARAPHPAPILGARLQAQKRDSAQSRDGEHHPGDDDEVHLVNSPYRSGDTRLALTNDSNLRSFNPSCGRSGDARIASGPSCQPAVSRPQWSHCNHRRADDRARRSS